MCAIIHEGSNAEDAKDPSENEQGISQREQEPLMSVCCAWLCFNCGGGITAQADLSQLETTTPFFLWCRCLTSTQFNQKTSICLVLVFLLKYKIWLKNRSKIMHL